MRFLRAWSGLFACLVAQEGGWAQEARRLDPVVVTGTRQSLESAQARKRDAAGVLDAVVAQDVHRLPDLNTADALKRVTGVQVGRDRGEGSTIAVRGLPQVETTFDGREVSTAGTGRTLDFADVAAETLAGIDLHIFPADATVPTAAHGWLDASLRRRVHERLTWSLDGVNLTRTLRRSDFGGPARPWTAWTNERQFATSLGVRF